MAPMRSASARSWRMRVTLIAGVPQNGRPTACPPSPNAAAQPCPSVRLCRPSQAASAAGSVATPRPAAAITRASGALSARATAASASATPPSAVSSSTR